MPITLAGSTGITTPGMESTAMPTVGGDAVVESGSNSDGEWTRFADGTQEAWAHVTATGVSWGASGSNLYYSSSVLSAPFPVAFVGDKLMLTDQGPASDKWTTDVVNPDSTQWAYRIISRASTTPATGDEKVFLFAKGRWK